MADSEQNPQKRIVRLSVRSQQDLESIYVYTLGYWGHQQADNYVNLIRETLSELAEATLPGRQFEDFPAYRCVSVRWKRATFSHIIVFRLTEGYVDISRIFHSAMDIPVRLADLAE